MALWCRSSSIRADGDNLQTLTLVTHMELIISSLVTLATKKPSLHAVMMATLLGFQFGLSTKLYREILEYTMAPMTLQ